MLNKKGSTLIESLLAFEIFITVLVVYAGLFISVYSQESRLNSNYQKMMEKESELSYESDFVSLIDKVLH